MRLCEGGLGKCASVLQVLIFRYIYADFFLYFGETVYDVPTFIYNTSKVLNLSYVKTYKTSHCVMSSFVCVSHCLFCQIANFPLLII